MQSIKSWFGVVLSATLVGTLVRIVFFILLAPRNLLTFDTTTPYLEILKAFFLGFRFDLSAVCYLTLLFWLASVILSKKWSLRVWKAVLAFWGFLLIVDIGYYSFYNDRINVLVFGLIEDDTWALIKTFWKNYPVLPILFITFLFAFYFSAVINRFFPPAGKRISSIWTRLLALILLIVGARGTFGLFPLGDHDTVVSSVPFLNTLSFGTAHSFSRAIKLKREQIKMGSTTWYANLKEFGYENQEDLAFQDYFGRTIPAGQDRFSLMKFNSGLQLKWPRKPHVVLVVMESWGHYGLQFQTPQFDLVGPMKRHFSEGLLNSQFLSSTAATTGSLSCLLAGLPQRAISPFLTESDYLQTRFSTSPALTYKKQGYTTRFIYGGNPGWRDMNKFALAQGFDFVDGEVDIEKKLKDHSLALVGRHDWGVFDEDVFRYVDLLLSEETTPQLLVVMTTTNHPPYDLPATAKNYNLQLDQFTEKDLLLDPKLALKRFTAFRYSSDSLAQFLDSVKANEKLNNQTLIAATADHTFWIKNFGQDETFIKSAVPFYLHVPNSVKQQLSTQQVSNFKISFGSHHDIWPTLYELTLQDAQYETFGRSLFNNSSESFSLTFERLIYSEDRAAFVGSGNSFSTLKALPHLKYTPTAEVTETDQQLAKKYRSLMGALDSYLYHSKMTP